ncbi:TPA: biotin transporter BioY [Candidatus Poribacteria bacterium]|nr:biotin transporter BioY [Candidatus Poribacteria bacterium]
MNRNNPSAIAITLTKGIPSSILKIAGVTTFVILTSVSAKVKIPLPFTPVPITLQVFFVLLSGSVLGSSLGALSQGIYVFLGLIGLPVWAGEGSGWRYLLGSTGGYLVGFIVAAYVVGILTSKRDSKIGNIFFPLVGYGVGVILIYGLGCLWLAIWANLFNGLSWNVATVVQKGALPFIAADTLKAFAAVLVLWMGRRIRN